MFLLFLVAYLVNRSVVMLVECGIKKNKYNLEELSEYLLGPFGYYLAIGSMFLFAYGGQIAYLVIIGDTVPIVSQFLFGDSSSNIFAHRSFAILFFSVLIILPLCLLRDLSHLSWTSFLSIFADVILIIIILIAALLPESSSSATPTSYNYQVSDLFLLNSDLFAGIGTMSFAFVCQHNSFLVYQTLEKNTLHEWKLVANISVAVSYALCVFLGLIGYFRFYPYVQGDLLNSFDHGNHLMISARALLAICMIFTYPMECYVSRHCLFSLWYHSQLPRYRSSDQIENNAKEKFSILNTSQSLSESHHHMIGSNDDTSNIEMINIEDQYSSNPLQDDLEEIIFDNSIHNNDITMHSKPDNSFFKISKRIQNNKYSVLNSCSYSNASSHITNDSSPSLSEPLYHEPQWFYHVLITLILWFTTVSIAIATKKLGVVSALTGAAAASTLGYTIPALIYLKTYEEEFRFLLKTLKSIFTLSHRQTSQFEIEMSSFDEYSDNHKSTDPHNFTFKKAFVKFFLPVFMIFFGLSTLFIGVFTVFYDNS